MPKNRKYTHTRMMRLIIFGNEDESGETNVRYYTRLGVSFNRFVERFINNLLKLCQNEIEKQVRKKDEKIL